MNSLQRISVFAAVGVSSFLAGKHFDSLSKLKDGPDNIFSNVYAKTANIEDDSVTSQYPVPWSEKAPSSGTQPTKSQRVSQIMKYGFPSLDNVRSYDDFVLAYDKRNRVAHWVIEHLTTDSVKHNDAVDRSKCDFHEDQSIHQYFRSKNSDYFKSGFDRGHLAAAGNHKASQQCCEQTFVLSNMAPQVGRGFNRDTWNRLEKYTRKLTKKYSNVYVCTGPLYLPRVEDDGFTYVKYRVIGSNHVAVPTHFFKVLLLEAPDRSLEMEAYVLPNQAISDDTPLTTFRVPPESIERASGLLFYERLPRASLKLINGKKPS